MTFLSRSTLAKVAVGKNRDCIRAATCIFNLGPFVCQPCQFVMLRIVIRNIHVHTLHRNRKNIPCELLSERTLGTCYQSIRTIAAKYDFCHTHSIPYLSDYSRYYTRVDLDGKWPAGGTK